MNAQKGLTYSVLLCSGTLLIGAGASQLAARRSSAGPGLALAASKPAPAQPKAPKAFAVPECKGAAANAAPAPGNPKAREAAQRGLDFLMAQTQTWQKAQNCYGCHVHAVTVEALSVGRHHQYRVPQPDLSAVLSGMLTVPGGARTKAGLSYHGDSLHAPSRAFGGAAFARYDQWVDRDLANDLMRVASELLAYQQHDGSIKLDWVNPPVGVGAIQGTYQAIQTWQQAYARSADDRWLTAVSRGEAFLQATIKAWDKTPSPDIQEINYAIMGLLAAGSRGAEATLGRLQRHLLAAQREDGGWGFVKGAASGPVNYLGKVQDTAASSAFTTGQTLYTLRLLGMTDRDPAIARGMAWLLSHQQQDGGWSANGFGKAEAMWGVLGLVSMDVLTVSLSGLQDGQHVDGTLHLTVEARDNESKGGGVARVDLLVDDVPVYSQCGGRLRHDWDTAGLAAGKHILTVVAHNAKGQKSSRSMEVYAGPVYLTQLGTNYEGGRTQIALRNIAPEGSKNTVEVRIFTLDPTSPTPKGAAELKVLSQAGRQGSMVFAWDGQGPDGKVQKPGKYLAQVSFRGADGKVVQKEEIPFVHDTPEAQRAAYSEVQGQLALPGDAPAANTMVELLDEAGNVVQRTQTTAAGQYRFRNVEEKKYKLRVAKPGFQMKEVPLAPRKAQETKADVKLY
jgi:squalene-hopene/tetraprenyl-beta-curcumene cyclase